MKPSYDKPGSKPTTEGKADKPVETESFSEEIPPPSAAPGAAGEVKEKREYKFSITGQGKTVPYEFTLKTDEEKKKELIYIHVKNIDPCTVPHFEYEAEDKRISFNKTCPALKIPTNNEDVCRLILDFATKGFVDIEEKPNEGEGKLTIKLNPPVNLGENKIELKKCAITNEEIVQQMCENLEDLFKKFDQLGKETDHLKNEIAMFWKELAAGEDYILDNYDKVKRLYSWIFPGVDENDYVKKGKRIYKATEDGDTAENFHSKVDGKGPTLIIIKTKGSNPKVFGGYTEVPWDKSGKNIKDEKAFVFDIEDTDCIKTSNPDFSVFCKSDMGPCFGEGGSDISIVNGFLKNKSSCKPKTFQTEKKLGGEETFEVEDIEVYEIIDIPADELEVGDGEIDENAIDELCQFDEEIEEELQIEEIKRKREEREKKRAEEEKKKKEAAAK